MSAQVIPLAAARAMRAPPSPFAIMALMLCASFARDVLNDPEQAAELLAKASAARRALATLPPSDPAPPPLDAA